MSTLSIRIPEPLRRELEKLCRRENRPLSEVVRDSLRRYVAAERFQALRKKTLPQAESQGFVTDEDIFKAVFVKAVLDTNVILAAFATRGLCEAVMTICLDRHQIVISEAILAEVRKHLAGKFKMAAARVQEIVTFLREHGEMTTPADVPADACRDPDDLAILGTALAGNVDCLVTGDGDLLAIKQIQGIPIQSPREFYDLQRQ